MPRTPSDKTVSTLTFTLPRPPTESLPEASTGLTFSSVPVTSQNNAMSRTNTTLRMARKWAVKTCTDPRQLTTTTCFHANAQPLRRLNFAKSPSTFAPATTHAVNLQLAPTMKQPLKVTLANVTKVSLEMARFASSMVIIISTYVLSSIHLFF